VANDRKDMAGGVAQPWRTGFDLSQKRPLYRLLAEVGRALRERDMGNPVWMPSEEVARR